MSQCDDRPITVARRRGRPVNSDSAETRNRILRAARLVINERGYQAATFQSISVRAGLSRPTLHYYFASRLDVYEALIEDSAGLVADLIAHARRPSTLAEQFSALVAALHEADAVDRSQVAFLVSARLESTRNPELRAHAGFGLQDCLKALVQDAKDRGELDAEMAATPVMEMLHAMFLGVGFYAGFVTDPADLRLVTGQLERVVAGGLPTRHDTNADTPRAVGGRQ